MFERDIQKLKDEFKRARELFITHYKNTYKSPSMPPVWAICEIMSLGLLSRFYSNLNSKEVRKAIADTYKLEQKIIKSLLRHLAYIRNLCAHHSRIWNRKFEITVKIPKSKPLGLKDSFNSEEERKLYNTLVFIAYMMGTC